MMQNEIKKQTNPRYISQILSFNKVSLNDRAKFLANLTNYSEFLFDKVAFNGHLIYISAPLEALENFNRDSTGLSA
jgi:hypothetical protein